MNGKFYNNGVYEIIGPETMTVNGSDVTQDATHRFVTDAEKTTWGGKVNKAGDTMTDFLIFPNGKGLQLKDSSATTRNGISITGANNFQVGDGVIPMTLLGTTLKFSGNDVYHAGNLTPTKIATGSYTGTGTTSPSITGFSFTPKMVFVHPNSTAHPTIFWYGITAVACYRTMNGGSLANVTWTASSVSWSASNQFWTGSSNGSPDSNGAAGVLNESGTTYYWIAIG